MRVNRLTAPRRSGVALLLALAVLTALTTSAAAKPSRATAQMNVFAAASLTEVFPKLDGGQILLRLPPARRSLLGGRTTPPTRPAG